MWLLSTDRAHIHFFPRPEDVPGGYAILSHVWLTEGEDTFQSVRGHRDLSKSNSEPPKSSSPPINVTNPRDLVSAKVRNFLIFAEGEGHQWAWVDTCCIDKTSSAELSEAINSMFRFYSLSNACYVYLEDVGDDGCKQSEWLYSHPRRAYTRGPTEFHNSKWHTRGWTLQELLASRDVVFMSRSWTPLGTKHDLAEMLEEATGVPRTVLQFEVGVTDVSVAARMSWAARRKTTRIEDEAYCLFGLFGINMPTLYGEGHRAFFRLQEEILKSSTDMSLLAWGDVLPSRHASFKGLERVQEPTRPERYLLTDSPRCFERCGAVLSEGFAQVTTEGDVHGPWYLMDLCCSLTNEPLFLILRLRADLTIDGRPVFQCGRCPMDAHYGMFHYRIVSSESSVDAGVLSWTMLDAYVQSYAPYRAESAPLDNPGLFVSRACGSVRSPFRFRLSLLSLASWRLVAATRVRLPWTGSEPLTVIYREPHAKTIMSVEIGVCMETSDNPTPTPASTITWADDSSDDRHYARVVFTDTGSSRIPSTSRIGLQLAGAHNCSIDHIDDWPDLRKVISHVFQDGALSDCIDGRSS
ncbi:HET-domain-containing protein [Epithele typhae]|uniref:HET-domain-containing protein n=1 Tax=Epithele typhae TaxID=378194 RepID=UPI0020087EA9|nr:HET-domain-containing protein [Epithele typhae]KAH9940409.1 HET-domain-containing protein [Epithele typhae]